MHIFLVAAPRSGVRELLNVLALSPDAAPDRVLIDSEAQRALEVSVLAARHPEGRFVYVYRDPREAVSSMLDGWRSGRFVTHPTLPGWNGPPWSFPLVPGWRDLSAVPLPELVARQWAAITSTLLDDLDRLDPGRWSVTSYDRLLADPAAEGRRLAGFAGLAWDERCDRAAGSLRRTVRSPDPHVWLHNAAELEGPLQLVEPVARRAVGMFGAPVATRPANPPTTSDAVAPAEPEPDDRDRGFSSVHTSNLPPLLAQLGVTVLVSTYQSGRVIALRSDGEQLNTHFRTFRRPMGLAADRRRLAIGTRSSVWEYRDHPAVAAKMEPAGRHDAAFIPAVNRVSGDIQVHELAYVGDELWVVATRFSCLATLDDETSFVPRWRPAFVSALAAEDRCHLNGMAVVDGAIRYVTAMGTTDTAGGWRENKADGGVVLDVGSGEVVAGGLSMPHSPRWHGGRLWVLSSGRGEVCTVDPADGAVEVVAKLPGFTRGLAFAGRYALVGLSQVRESVFGGIPLAEELPEADRRCGVWVLDTATGGTVGFLRFEGIVQELFDVQVLPGVRWPEIAEVEGDLAASSFVLPDEAMADVHVARP